MLADIQAWLEPPVFPNDSNKTRLAHTLNAILLVSLGEALVYILLIIAIAHVEFKSLVLSVIALVFILVLRSLLHKGFSLDCSTGLIQKWKVLGRGCRLSNGSWNSMAAKSGSRVS